MADRFFDAGLEERLEGWLDRGREFVDGVAAARPSPRRQIKRPLDAISRRTPVQESWLEESWPADESFTTPHWQRTEIKPVRPMPRSYRRRNN